MIPTYDLTFRQFQQRNAERCAGAFHAVNEWPMERWALAIAGETGELCNIIKKIVRGDFTLDEKRADVLRELADIITYADLAITRMGADTGDVVLQKFNEVSAKRQWPHQYLVIPKPW